MTVAYSSPTSIDADYNRKGRNETKVFHTVGVITPESLDNLVRRSDLIKEFTKALKEIREKEKANNDYETVWNLQK